VDVQNPLFSNLNSRLVIPFVRYESLRKTDAERLCPIILIHGLKYVLLSHQMTSVPTTILQHEEMSLKDFRYEILGAIDMLITGI
jgi:toxin CcdB